MGKKSMAAIAESMKALRALLEFMDAIARAILALLLAPLRALGLIGGGPTAAGIADAALAQVEAEDAYDERVVPVYEIEDPKPATPDFNVASSVWVRTLELRGMVKPGKAMPLSPEVEAWVTSLSPTEIETLSGLGLDGIAAHLTGTPAGTDVRLPAFKGGAKPAIDPIEAGLILARVPRRKVRTERPIAYDVETDTRSFAM